jgi:hypothetical protein
MRRVGERVCESYNEIYQEKFSTRQYERYDETVSTVKGWYYKVDE